MLPVHLASQESEATMVLEISDIVYWILVCLTSAVFIIVGHELVRPIDKRWSSMGKYSLPCGPRGSLILGDLPDFWKSRADGKTAAYFVNLKSYGEMTTLHMGSTLWVLLNSNRVVDEMCIGKRAKLTHERPHMPIAGSLVSKGMRSVTQPTRLWSELRRMMRPLLNADFSRKFVDWQDYESLQMLRSYLDDTSRWYLHNSRYATGVMHGIVAGDRLAKTEAEMQDYRRTTMEFLASIQSTTVDFFPFLEHMPRPLQAWRRKWEVMGDSHYKVFMSWWQPIKAKVISGKAVSSWTAQVLLNPASHFRGTPDEAAYLTNTVISAGGDNPRIALNTCLMASIVHTSAYETVRKEVDTISHSSDGSLQLPNTSHIPQMPHTCAFIKECLRYYPTVPMVPPHTSSDTFSFEQYTFPRGTSFILNVPAITRDYPDGDSFLPDRWIDGRGGEAKLTESFWGFGGGKRICIGYKAAQTGLFLPFARLVACFEMGKAGDFDDRNVNAWSPREPFPLKLRSRGEAYENLILREADACEMPTT